MAGNQSSQAHVIRNSGSCMQELLNYDRESCPNKVGIITADELSLALSMNNTFPRRWVSTTFAILKIRYYLNANMLDISVQDDKGIV